MEIDITQTLLKRAARASGAASSKSSDTGPGFEAALLPVTGSEAGPLPAMRKGDPTGANADAADERTRDTDPPQGAEPLPDANDAIAGFCVADAVRLARYPVAAAPGAEAGTFSAPDAHPVKGGPDNPALVTLGGQGQNSQSAQDLAALLAVGAAPPPGQAAARAIALTAGPAGQGAPNDLPQAMPQAAAPSADSPPVTGEGRATLSGGTGRPDQTGKPAPASAQDLPTGAVETSLAAGKGVAQSFVNSDGPAGATPSGERGGASSHRGAPTVVLRSPDTRGEASGPVPVIDTATKAVNLPKGATDQDGPAASSGVEPALPDAVKPDGGPPSGVVTLPAALAHGGHGRGRGNLATDLADPLATGAAGPPPPPAAAEPDRTNAMTSAHRPLSQSIAHQLALNISHQPGREVEITLSPDELGKVRMTVSAADGALTLSLTADRGDTLDLLRRHIDQLAQDFRDLGFDRLNFSFSQGRNDTAPDAKDWPTGGGADPPDTAPPKQATPPLAATLSGGLDLRL